MDPSSGLVVQGVDENYASEQKYRENLKQALRESAQMSTNHSTTAPSAKDSSPVAEEPREQRDPSLVDRILESIDLESQKLRGSSINDSDSVLIALYRSKLTEVIEEMVEANEKVQSAQAEVEKYRTKYRKLVELFRDVEVTEKAKLVIDLEKSRSSEAELASQTVVMQRELEQCRSKLRALGALK